jgi:hypothetical protein
MWDINMTNYIITVYTGDKSDAGTNAKVYIQLFGCKSHSNEVQLIGKFEKKSQDINTISTVNDLGSLASVHIRHDNSGHKPGWYLKSIHIENKDNSIYWDFSCNCWLATDEGDKRIYKVLSPDKYV